MKKVLLACLLLAFLFCAACGQQKEETAVPMPADGGDEAQIRLDPNDPLNSYLDLSQLDQATLAACTQTLDITSENNGVTATLRSVVGDAMTLYLTVDLPFQTPPLPFMAARLLILPWRRPQSPIPLKTPLMASDSREFSSQKIQYAICSPLPTGNPYSPPAKRSPCPCQIPTVKPQPICFTGR